MSGSIDAELDAVEIQCKALKAKFEGNMGAMLLPAILEYEQIDIALTKALSYVSLASDTKLDDDNAQKRKAALFQRYATISGNELTFFGLELADLPQAQLDAQVAAEPEALGKYAPYIDEVRRSQPYNLSKEVERALTVRAPFAGKGKVVEFYGNELSRLRFTAPGAAGAAAEEVNMEVLLAKMTSSKDAATRAECMQTLNTGLKAFERVAALSLNMVSGSWHAENTERGFQNLRSQRNLGNNVPDEVVDSLLDAVKTTGVDYCKR
jgi:oligoendopeptidase F